MRIVFREWPDECVWIVRLRVTSDYSCCHGLVCIRVQVLCIASVTKSNVRNFFLDLSAVGSVSGSSDLNRALVCSDVLAIVNIMNHALLVRRSWVV